MTFKEAQAQARAMGYTLRNIEDEFVAYPVGTGTEAPEAIFETSAEQALATITRDFEEYQSAKAYHMRDLY